MRWTEMTRKKGTTPAQARRNALADAIRARGESPYNIWVIRPPLEYEDILLTSDVAQELFYFLEGDHRFIHIRYPGLKASGSEQPVSIVNRIFAEVVTRAGKVLNVKFRHGLPLDPVKDAHG